MDVTCSCHRILAAISTVPVIEFAKCVSWTKDMVVVECAGTSGQLGNQLLVLFTCVTHKQH